MTTSTAVIIPSRNEPTTIRDVVTAVLEAVTPNIILNCDASDDDTTAREFLAACGANGTSFRAEKRGKGAQILAALHRILPSHDGPILIVDSDLKNPDRTLFAALSASIASNCGFALPDYRRLWFEGNLTNHVLRPLFASCFGSDISQPIAGELAIHSRVAQRAIRQHAMLPPQLKRCGEGYGIDILLACIAANTDNIAVVETEAIKLHAPSFPHLRDIFWGAVPIMLHFASACSAHLPDGGRYRIEGDGLDFTRWIEMDNKLAMMAPPVPPKERWVLALGNAIVAAASSDALAAASRLWPHYIARVRSYFAAHWNKGNAQAATAYLENAHIEFLEFRAAMSQ